MTTSSASKRTKSQKIKKENTEKQWMFFYTLFQASDKVSMLSGEELKGPFTSMWFHHIYPKSKFPELRFCPENIIIVTADEHNQIESGITFKELEIRKEYISENYEELVTSTKEYIEDYLNPVYEHAKKNTVFFSNRNNQINKK
jgi:hypothetical protein